MKRNFMTALLVFFASCSAEKSGPALVEAKMYMHEKTYIFDDVIFSAGNSGILHIQMSSGDHFPQVSMTVYTTQPGTYQITSFPNPGDAHFSAYWYTEFGQETFDNIEIVTPNDSNTITIDHCSPFKVSGSFHTYIDSIHWSTPSGTYLATGTFNFEAQ